MTGGGPAHAKLVDDLNLFAGLFQSSRGVRDWSNLDDYRDYTVKVWEITCIPIDPAGFPIRSVDDYDDWYYFDILNGRDSEIPDDP